MQFIPWIDIIINNPLGVIMKKTKPKMNSIEVKVWLLRNGIEMKGIAANIGLSPTLVSLTINNHYWNRKVADELARLGCPPKHLGGYMATDRKGENNAA
jgi:hypothetical protein